MFRSASTLQFQITSRLVEDAGIGQSIGWIDANRFSETRDAWVGKAGLKVIKVHVCTDPIQAEFLRGTAIGIYIYRDIRDVFASYLKQRQKSFSYLIQEGFIETCLDNYKIWTSLPNVLVSRYVDVIQDLPGEVCRIAHHLGIPISATTCETIAADYQLELQQKRIQKFREELLSNPLNPNDHRDLVDYHDEKSLLHINHIDSAKVDRWRDDLSESEATLIEQKVQEWCEQSSVPRHTFLG